MIFMRLPFVKRITMKTLRMSLNNQTSQIETLFIEISRENHLTIKVTK